VQPISSDTEKNNTLPLNVERNGAGNATVA
jgi:hypothetical protein